jgi:SAM-dependent methyltransferase
MNPANTRSGYNLWSKTYDLEDNFLVWLEKFYSNKRLDCINSFIGMRKCCLDIGCGTGRHLAELEENFEEVFGIDLSEEMLLKAESKINKSKTVLICEDFYNLNIYNKFDFLNCSLALMHFQNIEKFFQKSYSLLAKNGVLFLVDASYELMKQGTSPNFNYNGTDIIVNYTVHKSDDILTSASNQGFELIGRESVIYKSEFNNERFSRYENTNCLSHFVFQKRIH